MPSVIKVDENALQTLKKALETAGSEYKRNLAKLDNLIVQITQGDITGNPATDLLNKYKEKEGQLKKVLKTIEEAEEYVGVKNTKFNDMISGLSSSIR